jgi:hypothetical protein
LAELAADPENVHVVVAVADVLLVELQAANTAYGTTATTLPARLAHRGRRPPERVSRRRSRIGRRR